MQLREKESKLLLWLSLSNFKKYMSSEYGPSLEEVGIETEPNSTEQEQTEASKLREAFLRPSFLVVEDEPDVGHELVAELRAQRSANQEKKDAGVVLVQNLEDCRNAIDGWLTPDGPTEIVVILDMQFPRRKDGFLYADSGRDALRTINNKVVAWNSEHPDHNIDVKIIINSTSVKSEEEARKIGGIGFSPKKSKAVSVVAELFKKGFKNNP